MAPAERTAVEWFTEAARWYVERHQGCPWCGGSHRVYQRDRDGRLEFFCNGCDFHAGFVRATETFFAHPGAVCSSKNPETMYEF